LIFLNNRKLSLLISQLLTRKMTFNTQYDLQALTFFITLALISLVSIQFLNLHLGRYHSSDLGEAVNDATGVDDGSEKDLRKQDTACEDDTSSLDPSPELDEALSMASGWKCACKGGFLPPGLLKSFGGAEAVMLLGVGQCYHSKAS
jgi:hypothetical protein